VNLTSVLFDPKEREAVRGQGGDGGGDGVRRRDDLRPLLRQALPHLLHHHLRGPTGGCTVKVTEAKFKRVLQSY